MTTKQKRPRSLRTRTKPTARHKQKYAERRRAYLLSLVESEELPWSTAKRVYHLVMDQGWSAPEIASYLWINRNTISSYIRDMGLPTNKPIPFGGKNHRQIVDSHEKLLRLGYSKDAAIAELNKLYNRTDCDYQVIREEDTPPASEYYEIPEELR